MFILDLLVFKVNYQKKRHQSILCQSFEWLIIKVFNHRIKKEKRYIQSCPKREICSFIFVLCVRSNNLGPRTCLIDTPMHNGSKHGGIYDIDTPLAELLCPWELLPGKLGESIGKLCIIND